jgi:hypothetical protein
MRTLVWDIDDVLNNLMEMWLRRWREQHPGAVPDYASITRNPPHELLGITLEAYLESLDQIRSSVSAHEELIPHPQITAWLVEHGHRYRHLALTARPAHAAGPAAAWVLGHFGAWIRTAAFVPVRKPGDWPDYDLNKADYLRWLDPDAILIDDSPANVSEAREKGLAAVLFPQPWNAATQSVPETLNQLAEY